MARGEVAWDAVIGTANRDLLVPALWASLRQKGLDSFLSDRARDVLRRQHRYNLLKNEKLREQACEVARALNAVGLVPILLKGGTHLFEDTFGDPGVRSMLDLDFLVRMGQVDRAIAVLHELGYRPQDVAELDFQHRPMIKAGAFGPVEIHRYIGEQREVLTPDEAWSDCVELSAGDARLLALSPTHRVIHNVFHSEVQDRGHELGFIWPRQLHDLVGICRFHAAHIDWAAIDRSMTRHGLGATLRARLYLATRCLGLPVVADLHPGPRAKLHYYRCRLQIRVPALSAAARFWGGATAPLRKHAIDLAYGCGTRPLAVNAYRVHHVLQLIRRHRGRFWRKIRDARSMYG